MLLHFKLDCVLLTFTYKTSINNMNKPSLQSSLVWKTWSSEHESYSANDILINKNNAKRKAIWDNLSRIPYLRPWWPSKSNLPEHQIFKVKCNRIIHNTQRIKKKKRSWSFKTSSASASWQQIHTAKGVKGTVPYILVLVRNCSS